MKTEIIEVNEEEYANLRVEDPQGTEAFTAWHGERMVLRAVAGGLALLLGVSAIGNVKLALQPPKIVWVRVDAIAGAQAVQYSSLNYTPTEGVIRKSLDDFGKLYLPRLRSTLLKDHASAYYFLDSASGYSNQVHEAEQKSKQIPSILANQAPEYDAVISSVLITKASRQSIGKKILAVGEAEITYTRSYQNGNSVRAHDEIWKAKISYFVNPDQVAEQSQKDPQYAFVNPLGVSITDIHETQVIQ